MVKKAMQNHRQGKGIKNDKGKQKGKKRGRRGRRPAAARKNFGGPHGPNDEKGATETRAPPQPTTQKRQREMTPEKKSYSLFSLSPDAVTNMFFRNKKNDFPKRLAKRDRQSIDQWDERDKVFLF
jgi:hypothetical protein